MFGSVSVPGVELFEVTNAVGELARQVMLGEVSTDLVAASNEPIYTNEGVEIVARLTLETQEDEKGAQDKILVMLNRMIAAESEAIASRVKDDVMGALMAGDIASILTDRAGNIIATKKGETIMAHRVPMSTGEQLSNKAIGEIFSSVFSLLGRP